MAAEEGIGEMQLQVDPSCVLDLSEAMKRLNRVIEENETGLNRDLSRLVNEVRYAYNEPDVQAAVREVERLQRKYIV